MLGLDICNVLGAVGGLVNNFLPSIREFRLPFEVPFCFVFPPRVVAGATSLVSPMPNPDFSAPGDHRVIANWTLACKIGASFLALPIDEREFHILIIAVSCKPVCGVLGETSTRALVFKARPAFDSFQARWQHLGQERTCTHIALGPLKRSFADAAFAPVAGHG